MNKKTQYETLLDEAASFKTRLTKPEHICFLEKKLQDSMENFDIECPEKLEKNYKGIGIYYLEAKFPFSDYEELEGFGAQWGRVRSLGVPPAIPRYYPERAKKHKQSISEGKFIPFYLGKRLDIKDRMRGHILGKKIPKHIP